MTQTRRSILRVGLLVVETATLSYVMASGVWTHLVIVAIGLALALVGTLYEMVHAAMASEPLRETAEQRHSFGGPQARAALWLVTVAGTLALSLAAAQLHMPDSAIAVIAGAGSIAIAAVGVAVISRYASK